MLGAASKPEGDQESVAASGPEVDDDSEAHGEPEGEEDREPSSSSEPEGDEESSYSGSDGSGNVRRVVNPDVAYELLRNHPLKPFYRLQSWSKAKVEEARAGDRTSLVSFLRELSGYPDCFDRNNRLFTNCECFASLAEDFYDSLAYVLGELFCLVFFCHFCFV